MARQSSSGSSFLRSLFARLWKRPEVKAASRRTRRRMFMEPLEGRAVMASDLGWITGIVFVDATGDGLTSGEEVANATLNLYLDDGDGVFEPGAGDGAILESVLTDSNGEYTFTDLAAGDYWVHQIGQVVSPHTLASISQMVTVTPTDAQGNPGTLIDSFITAGQPTSVATDPVNSTDFDTADLPTSEVIGGERDFLVELTSTTGGQQVEMTVAAGKLSLNPSIGAQGKYNAVWDGDDNDGNTIDFTLLNVDLTDGGNSAGIVLEDVLADQTGGTATIRVYTDASNYSELTINIPDTLTSDLFFKFADFTSVGAGANFAAARAIELEVAATVDAMDVGIELIQAIGYAGPDQVDFDNFSASDLELGMVVDDATPNVGDSITFTITVTNGGPDDATNVAVEDALPAGLTFVSDNPSVGTYDETTGVWTIGTIASGGSVTLEIVALVATLGVKTNTAEVSASDADDVDSTPGNGVVGEDDIGSVVITPQEIDLSLTKTVDSANVAVGSSVTFTITVANAAGMDNATGVVVKDLLPPGFTYVSENPSQGTYDELTGIWTVGAINAGANATLQIVATKTATGAIVNIAEITAADQADTDSTPDNRAMLPNEDDSDTETVNDLAIDLDLVKIVDNATQSVGQNVTFTLTVSNTGLGDATGVVVADLLPAGLTFVSDNPSQGSYDELTGIWTVGAINTGSNATLQIVATVATAGVKTNLAEVTAADQPDVDSTPGNSGTAPNEDDTDSVTVTPPSIDLSIDKTVNNAAPTVGQNVVFTIVVSNAAGVSDATGVVVEDLLPAGLTFVTSTQSQGTYTSGTGVWTVGSLAAGANATLTITATAATAGAKTNLAEVTAADQPDVDSTPDNSGVAPNEDDTDTVVVTPVTAPSIDLSIDKTVNNAAPTVGQNVVFTIVVSNAAGVSDATGVVVEDLLPAGLTFVTSTQSQGTYTSGTGVWTVGSLAAGANATLTITATAATAGAKTNLAEVTAADQADVDSTPDNSGTAPNEDDTDTVVVTPVTAPTIDLSLTKTVNTANPNKDQQVTFTVTVSNAAGQANATGVNVTDQLPAGMTFVSSTPSVGTYNSTTGVWTVGNLAAGASATLSIVATATTIGAKVNTAQVSAADQTDIDSTPGNAASAPGEDDTASVTVTPAVADLSLTKTVDDATPDRNQNVVFTITLANAGTDAATNVTVTDLLPAGLTFVSSNPSVGSYNSTTGVWTVANLAAAGNATLTITATVVTVGAKTNTAEVTASDQFDSDSTPGNRATTPNEDDTASVVLTPNATDLSVTKSVNDTSPNLGDNVTFTVTVSNTSATNATNVVLTDLLPAGLAFVSSNPSQGTYVSGTGLWTIGTVNANSSVTLTVVATVTSNTTKVNAAEITSLDQFDIDSIPGNGSTTEDDRATVTVQPFLLSKRLGVVR